MNSVKVYKKGDLFYMGYHEVDLKEQAYIEESAGNYKKSCLLWEHALIHTVEEKKGKVVWNQSCDCQSYP